MNHVLRCDYHADLIRLPAGQVSTVLYAWAVAAHGLCPLRLSPIRRNAEMHEP